MAYQNRVSFPSWCEYWKQKITSKIFSRPGGAASQVWYHLQRINRICINKIFNKYLDPCHACGHKPTSVLLWCRLCGMMVVRMLGRQRCMKRCRNFSKGCQWWSNLGVRCYWLGYDAYKPDPSLPPLSIHVRGPSTFLVLSTLFHISSTSFANYLLTACWYE